MLKVAKDDVRDGFEEYNNAAILGEELPSVEQKDNGSICECEARVRAYMSMIRIGESSTTDKAYTMAFGGSQFTDISKHPEKNYGGSTAAGAYQVMRFTWWELNGFELNRKFQKTGKYIENKDYIKKYNIKDYSPESQDKICVILLKHKRAGILPLIINDKIEKATRKYGSLEWASLPYEGDNSKYDFKGKPQPATKMKDVLSHYEEYYEKELKGITNLHIEKGFLKEFGFPCCKQN